MPEKVGRYKIVRELGRGAMGVVYEGVDPNTGRRVAIKTPRPDVMEATGRADETVERFLRQASVARGLNHPNIITIYEAGEEGDEPALGIGRSSPAHLPSQDDDLLPQELVLCSQVSAGANEIANVPTCAANEPPHPVSLPAPSG